RGVEAAFGGALLPTLRHQASRMRAGLERDRQHFLRCRHFEIERLRDFRLEPRDIVVADMPAVLAQVGRDAVGAGRNRHMGGLDRIGMNPAARIAQRRHVVDVDAEPDMRNAGHDQQAVISDQLSVIILSIISCNLITDYWSLITDSWITRSALATTSLARSWAMIEVRCLRSYTSRSISTSVKSGAPRVMRILSMLPSWSAITWAIWASVPGSLTDCSLMRAGKRCVLFSSTSQRTSSQRSGVSSNSLSAGDWMG